MNEDKFIQELAKDHSRTLLGYVEREEGYYPIYQSAPGSIVTHAFILCKYCQGAISGSGGPKYDAVCIPCFEKDPNERTTS
jgi:hypothetical protein